MDVNNFLKNLGLTSRQCKIYLALSNNDYNISSLSKLLELPRSTIYLEFSRMEKKGFVVSTEQNNQIKYSLTPFENLKFIVEQKKSQIDFMSKDADEVINFLKKSKSIGIEKRTITTYKKGEGIKQLLWNIVTSGEKELIGFSPGTLEDVTDREFAEKWRLEFQRRKMFNRIILNSHVKMNWSNVKDFLKVNVKAKTLEAEKIRFEREILIYGNTVAIISKKDDPDQYGVVIQDKLLVDSYKQMFEYFWKEVGKRV